MTHTARKRFGQNFLHDQSIIYNILGSLQAEANAHWVEIGPGQGALTQPLLDKGVRLDVVELDRDLVASLQKHFAGHPRLTIHSADALSFDFASLASAGKKLHVIGNLPYNISTPLLFHLLENTTVIADMTFMLQKEVVARICAPPGSKTYGRLSIMMQYYCATEFLFEVPPECFEPAPKVTSAVIKLIPHQQAPVIVNNLPQMGRIITQAFSQRRKTLRNALKKITDAALLIELGIDPVRRPETLTLAEFAAISNALAFLED
ncbi:MAG: 16S rRNA (adenine(1518)-N(6)/adenine(1519)-N(6))-dimethyltransferase RsmA [Methylococcaceae bacterium]|nr:16S rRNA (adenine(1518)-N(6)/adenine(1519)-N(6))-dimethyltransferase RsmA [Methylococcaceae bacterium]